MPGERQVSGVPRWRQLCGLGLVDLVLGEGRRASLERKRRLPVERAAGGKAGPKETDLGWQQCQCRLLDLAGDCELDPDRCVDLHVLSLDVSAAGIALESRRPRTWPLDEMRTKC